MSIQACVSHPLYNFLPTEIEGFDSLAELALDLSSSWNHATDEVWRRLDPILCEPCNRYPLTAMPGRLSLTKKGR
jgi:starch phosphorylase